MAEPRSRPDVVYSIRIFPIQKSVADGLETEFSGLVSTRRFLPHLDGWNLVLDIGSDTDVGPVVNALRREGLDSKFDLFLSLVPESDSIISGVPKSVIKIIQEFGCPIMVSYTSGAWGSSDE